MTRLVKVDGSTEGLGLLGIPEEEVTGAAGRLGLAGFVNLEGLTVDGSAVSAAGEGTATLRASSG